MNSANKKPPVHAFKNPVSQPRAAQAKFTGSIQQKKQPNAPPVYRPQPIPKVLQRKTTGNERLPLAPPAIKKTVVPAKPPLPIAQTRFTPVQFKSSTVQLASRTARERSSKRIFKRTHFSSEVKKTIRLRRGQHRRHIIANHLMKNMLEVWWALHKNDEEGSKTSAVLLQKLLAGMNNYKGNLVPGPGAANSAIGMLSTAIPGKLRKLKTDEATPKEMKVSIARFQGFQQDEQKRLMTPVLAALTKDEEVKSSHAAAVEFVEDLHVSTDFDWPGGTSRQFDDWFGMYQAFRDIESNPGNYTYEQLKAQIKKFLKLTKPSGRH